MRITSAGNVGIGTSSPAAPLHILKTATGINTATTMLKLSSVDTNPALYVGFQAQRDNSAGQGLNILVTNVSGTVSEAMNIAPTGAATFSSSINTNSDVVIAKSGIISASNITLKSNGNVGIGTTTPTSKLQVTGLLVFANNADAVAGGLTSGAFYTNASGTLSAVL